MTLIPVNPEDFPTTYELMPEDAIYTVELREFKEAPKTDKKGNAYLYAELEIIEPVEWAGRKLTDNYIGIPTAPSEDMTVGERRQSLESGIKFAQICRCFQIKSGPNGVDLSAALGNQGQITTYHEEYNGRKFSRIRDYLAPKSE